MYGQVACASILCLTVALTFNNLVTAWAVSKAFGYLNNIKGSQSMLSWSFFVRKLPCWSLQTTPVWQNFSQSQRRVSGFDWLQNSDPKTDKNLDWCSCWIFLSSSHKNQTTQYCHFFHFLAATKSCLAPPFSILPSTTILITLQAPPLLPSTTVTPCQAPPSLTVAFCLAPLSLALMLAAFTCLAPPLLA